jgi:hypothetical protein
MSVPITILPAKAEASAELSPWLAPIAETQPDAPNTRNYVRSAVNPYARTVKMSTPATRRQVRHKPLKRRLLNVFRRNVIDPNFCRAEPTFHQQPTHLSGGIFEGLSNHHNGADVCLVAKRANELDARGKAFRNRHGSE